MKTLRGSSTRDTYPSGGRCPMANVVKKHSIASELAQKMVEAEGAKARELGVCEDVAILDDGGNLKGFSPMDGAPLLSIQIAHNKADTALFAASTPDLVLRQAKFSIWRFVCLDEQRRFGGNA